MLPANVANIDGTNILDSWPVSQSGTDFSIIANNLTSDQGYFAVGSHEQYLAFYQPAIKAGTVHIADPASVPGKKTWTWATTNPWPPANLSDDNSNYIEIQGGATPSQTTYYYLQPQLVLNFTEYWLPMRSIDGISEANSTAVVYLARTAGGITAEVEVTSSVPGATIQLWQNGQILNQSANVTLAPETNSTLTGQTSDPSPVTFLFLDSNGNTVLTYTEGVLNADPVSNYTLGAQPSPLPAQENTPAACLEYSGYNLRLANYDYAIYDFTTGLTLAPGDPTLSQGYGRLLTSLSNPGAPAPLSQGLGDAENQYYSGLANLDPNALTAVESDPTFGLSRQRAPGRTARRGRRQCGRPLYDSTGPYGWTVHTRGNG
jgi:hypothetical protein